MKNAKIVIRAKIERSVWEKIMDLARKDYRSGHALVVKILTEYARAAR